MTTTSPPTRLMLVTPPVADAEAMAFRLMQAQAGGDLAAVLLQLAPGDERSRIERVKRLAGPVQGANVALVVADSALVADGAATALFFDVDPAFLRRHRVKHVRLFADGRFDVSADFPGELFP